MITMEDLNTLNNEIAETLLECYEAVDKLGEDVYGVEDEPTVFELTTSNVELDQEVNRLKKEMEAYQEDSLER